MAFKSVMGSNLIKTKEMQVGDFYEGYLLGTVPSAMYKDSRLIKLLDKEGNVLTLTPTGNLSYVQQNLDDENHGLTSFALTRITKTGTRESKSKIFRDPVGVFLVEQDFSDMLDEEEGTRRLTEESSDTSAAAASS